MKKCISVILILILSAMLLTGCNYKMVDTKWDFDYAYLTLPDGKVLELNVKSWSEDETTITIQDEDGNVYCTSAVNIILSKEQIKDFSK